MKLRVLVALSFVCLLPPAVEAQTPSVSGAGVGSAVTPFREYATRELKDPWDMGQRTDVGWLTWGADQPQPNMTGLSVSGGIFSGTPSNSDPSFFLLDTWQPGSSQLGKIGVNHPIDTTVYNYLLVKMKLPQTFTAGQLGTLGTVPSAEIFWSRDTIYFDATARPNGGFITATDGAGNQVGIGLTPRDGAPSPSGGIEGGQWVIYRYPLTNLGSVDNRITQWKNVGGGANSQWGAAGVTADSLRFDPVNLSGTQLGGAVQIDWARLVSYDASSQTTVTWSGGTVRDIVVSTNSNCSDYGVIKYTATTGYQFPPQMLPPGTYYVGLRDPFTNDGFSAGGAILGCSTSTITVSEYPTLTLTSPNPEGSADDFATVFLGNSWDMNALSDIDFARNLTLPDANYGIVTKAATDPAGNDLGNVRVYRAKSNAGSPATGNVGDAHFYTLWPVSGGGATPRGLNNRIDASRYRLFTSEVSIERARDVNHGSIARVVWHVSGDKDGSGAFTENVTQDIVLRHLDPATQNNGKIVLDTVQFDMADRGSVPHETDAGGSPSTSGWTNTCSAPAGCASSPAHKAGIDIFRFDPHEFDTQVDFDVKRLKLAALERTGSSFNITWTSQNPSSLSATVSLRAIGYRNEAGRDLRPASISCTGGVSIATGLSLSSGTYSWQPGSTAGITNGGEYFVCAQIVVGGTVVQEYTARFPVKVDTSFTGLRPTLTMDRATLRFSGVHSGRTAAPVFSSKSPAETIRIVQTGAGTVNWTIAATDTNGNAIDWLAISKTSGTGSTTFTVGLAESTNLPACSVVDGLGATLKLTSDASNAPQYIQIYVTIRPGAGATPGAGCPFTAGATSAPFGQVDTPSQSATGVVGAIGVTGWVLDDVGIQNVKIYRNCLGFDNPASCQTIGGNSVVFVGDAAFLAGARPDVEAAFETSPYAYRAGWGYLMLTPMLPHVTNAQQYGGHGPLTLYVYATDVEGKVTLLGRSQSDATPTSITMNNDNITKPFGAIDTPGQGETVGGLLHNFGWVLTPDGNTVADGGDILIPTNGSTATVFIDGAPVAQVAYNQCRGTVGNPVPSSSYCNDDVSNIFGHTSPLAPLTARDANPTRHRNLDAGRGPIGVHSIDTTALSNGLHTIAWGVTDSANRSEGIGSRFFNVVNGASDAASALALADRPANTVLDGRAADAVLGQRQASGAIYARTGFDLNAPWQALSADAGGTLAVRLSELGRLELWLGAGLTDGYMRVGGALRALPPGSRLADGQFTWAPAAGYLGDYTLVFSGRAGQAAIRVTVVAKPVDGAAIRAEIDAPKAGQAIGGSFTIGGWAVDVESLNGSGVGAVHVWAFRRDGAGAPVTFVGAANVNGVRPDVAASQGAQYGTSGWALTAGALPAGEYEIVAYFWSTRTGRFEDARSVRVTIR